jgi:hypothetical protein
MIILYYIYIMAWKYYIRQNRLYIRFRLKKYKIYRFYNKKWNVLEVGSNKGVLSNILVNKFKSYTIVEKNNYEKFQKNYDSKINTNFINFKKFKDIAISNNKKYDFILFLAVLGYIYNNEKELLNILDALLNINGIILIENTTKKLIEKKLYNYIKMNNTNFKIIDEGNIREIDQTRIFFYINKYK